MARPLRTILAVAWERRDGWVVRARADLLVARAVGLAAVALAAAALAAIEPGLGLAAAPGLLAAAAVAWAFTRAPGGARLDLRGAVLEAGGERVALVEVQALRLATELRIRRSRRGTSARQLWTLAALRAGGDAALPLAAHGDEAALLHAAIRLAAAMEVPVLDLCGPEGTGIAWNPADDRPLAALLRGGQAPRRPAGEPSSTVREEPAPDRTVLSWRGFGPAALLVLPLGAAPLAASALALARLADGPYRWAALLAAAVAAPLFLRALRWCAAHGASSMVVAREGVRARSGLAGLPSRRVALGDLRLVRISTELAYAPRAPGEVARRVAHLDLVGARGVLLRVSLRAADAVALKWRLEAALARLAERTSTSAPARSGRTRG